MSSNKSISETLSVISNKISDLEDRATRATRKYLVEIGIPKSCVDKYCVNCATGGEWILDSVNHDIDLACCDILVGDDLTIEEIRHLAGCLSDEEKTELGLL